MLVAYVSGIHIENVEGKTSFGNTFSTQGMPVADVEGLVLHNVKCDETAIAAASVTECFAIHGSGPGGAYGFVNPIVNGIVAECPVSAAVNPYSAGFEFWNAKNGSFTNINTSGLRVRHHVPGSAWHAVGKHRFRRIRLWDRVRTVLLRVGRHRGQRRRQQ
ncbi:MAG: hypothetical protein WDM81_18990 [Rhizomicrobium sp.]